jgi:hypothetical protein
MSLSTLQPKKNTSNEYVQKEYAPNETLRNETLAHPLRRLVKRSYDRLHISRYPYRELALFHRQLQLRLMELFAGRVYIDAFPVAIRHILDDDQRPPGMISGTFRDSSVFFKMLIAYIASVKDDATEDRLVMVKSVPRDLLRDADWAVEIAPHCRFMYLEAQKLLFLHVNVETRYIESFAREQLHYDDTDEGVEGHALGRIDEFLAQQLSGMNSPATEYEFLALKSCTTNGIYSSPYLEEDIKSTRSCDRMFVSRLSTSSTTSAEAAATDANGNPWPTLVIETGPGFYNPASRWYMHYAVDWWFSQSEGTTKIVLLLYFDHFQRETIVEKWVYDAQHLPFKKRLAQTLIVNLSSGSKKANNQMTEIAGDTLVLELDALLGREKGEGETDVVLDKETLGVYAEGFLLHWRNLGRGRLEALDRDKIRPPELPSSSPPAVSTFSPELTDFLEIPQYPPFTMPSAVPPKNPFLPADSSQTE